jgi:hypothetical protein
MGFYNRLRFWRGHRLRRKKMKYYIKTKHNVVYGPAATLDEAKARITEEEEILVDLASLQEERERLTGLYNEKDAELSCCRQALAQVENERQSLATVLIPSMLEVIVGDSSLAEKLRAALDIEDNDSITDDVSDRVEERILDKVSDKIYDRIADSILDSNEFVDAVTDVVRNMSFSIETR